MKPTTADDEALLVRFLGGELDAAAIEALEARIDQEPALASRLGALARAQAAEEEAEAGPASPPSRRPPSLALGPRIGEGGMGIVHLGRQHSVDREVAIKTVRSPDAPTDLLLEEAYVTAALEHPNIVPVHDIVFADDGRPQIVLKHIEGDVWRDLIHDPTRLAARGGVAASDPLGFHLRIFLEICAALRFAHDRGFIHRDVKPANVMVGAYDDVYLLDWGLALSLDADAPSPTVQRARGLAGTPAYMAPEQLDPEGRLGPATDVYQLGGTLYEIVSGRPPHGASERREPSVVEPSRADERGDRSGAPDRLPSRARRDHPPRARPGAARSVRGGGGAGGGGARLPPAPRLGGPRRSG